MKQEDLARIVAESSSAVGDLQTKIERNVSDTHSLKECIRNNEARLDVWQRELRELRRHQLGSNYALLHS